METINTVNFEDLFDFSPERVDGAGSATPADKTVAVKKGTGKSGLDAFAKFDAILAGEEFERDDDVCKLSASVPKNWGFSSTSGTSAEQSFTVGSVSQLLQDLPHSTPKPKRGRKPGQKTFKTDMKTKLERSRQSARECRARKKLRYQYLDDLIAEREKANEVLREELLCYQKWCHELDKGRIPDGLHKMLKELGEDALPTTIAS